MAVGRETGAGVIANDARRMTALSVLSRQRFAPNAFMWTGLPRLLPGMGMRFDNEIDLINCNYRIYE